MALWSLWVSLRKSGFEVSSSQLSSKQQISNFSLLTEAIEWRRSIRFIARREMSINGSMSPPPSSFPTPHSPATPLKTQESLQWKRFDCLPNFFHFTVHWSLKDQPAGRTDRRTDGRTATLSCLFFSQFQANYVWDDDFFVCVVVVVAVTSGCMRDWLLKIAITFVLLCFFGWIKRRLCCPATSSATNDSFRIGKIRRLFTFFVLFIYLFL